MTLSLELLRQIMQTLNDDSSTRINAILQNFLEDISNLLVVQLWHEPVVDLIHDFLVVLVLEVCQVGVNHQVHEIQNVVHLVSQELERLNELVLEGFVVLGTVTAHKIHHSRVNSHFGGQALLSCVGLLAKDEAEVNVEEMTMFIDHQIFQMPIANTKEVSGGAVPSCGIDESIKNILEPLDGFIAPRWISFVVKEVFVFTF